jgi:hypothetical protein
MSVQLDPQTRAFYCRALELLNGAGIPFLVGGAYAMERYTGISRHTKDFDVFVRPSDAQPVMHLFAASGYETEWTHPHWLGKVRFDDAYVDVIYRSGNGVAEVDDAWFEHAVADEVLGVPVGLCPAEEIIWSKAYIMERERFDGGDVAHLLLNCGEELDWNRLVARFGPHWPVLLSHLVLFVFIYPTERKQVPGWVMDDLLGRLRESNGRHAEGQRVCRGTLLSRSQYLIDIEQWGFRDERLRPGGTHMTRGDVQHWTEAIDIDGQR